MPRLGYFPPPAAPHKRVKPLLRATPIPVLLVPPPKR